MRVLLITHVNLFSSNVRLFSMIGSEPGISLTVLVPHQNPGEWPKAIPFAVLTARLRDPQNYLSGFVESDLAHVIRSVAPAVIQCLTEPFSMYMVQSAAIATFVAPSARCLFYGYENMPQSKGLRNRIKLSALWLKVAGGAVASTGAATMLRDLGFPSAKPLRLIPWGIDTHAFKPMDKMAVRQELHIVANKLVGFVGRLVPEKGVMTLMAAMTSLPQHVHCLLIGDGPLYSEVKSMCQLTCLENRVHLRGGVGAGLLGKYMNAIDVLVLPSVRTANWSEQYGRVLPEAMACGTPVVGSNSGAIPEVIGDAGLLFEENDASALSSSILSLVGSDKYWDEMSIRALSRSKGYTDVAMSQALAGFYRSIVS